MGLRTRVKITFLPINVSSDSCLRTRELLVSAAFSHPFPTRTRRQRTSKPNPRARTEAPPAVHPEEAASAVHPGGRRVLVRGLGKRRISSSEQRANRVRRRGLFSASARSQGEEARPRHLVVRVVATGGGAGSLSRGEARCGACSLGARGSPRAEAAACVRRRLGVVLIWCVWRRLVCGGAARVRRLLLVCGGGSVLIWCGGGSMWC
jgi:hypothetical protein